MRIRGAVFAGGIALLMLVIFASIGFGQGQSGSISGTVYDQSGAVVPNAQVTLTREGTGDIRRVQSNSEGFFSIVALPCPSLTMTFQ